MSLRAIIPSVEETLAKLAERLRHLETEDKWQFGNIRNADHFAVGSVTGGIAEAITNLGGSQGVVYAPPKTYPFNANYTVPANVHLIFAKGAICNVANGVTLTINGTIEAGDYQIFAWVGTGSVAGLSFINACWFGAVADSGVTDNATAFAKAAASAGARSTLCIPDKVGQSYHYSSGFTFGQHYAQLKADGLLHFTGTAGAAVTLGVDGSWADYMKVWLRLEKSSLDWTETCTGVRFSGVRYSEVHIHRVAKFTYGIELLGSAGTQNYYNKIFLERIADNKIGIHFNGPSGSMNANDWYGGGFRDNNLGGANYAGSYGINMPYDAANLINGNTFYSPKFEANTSNKITNWIRCGGRCNTFVNPRLESTCSDVMVRFLNGGDRNCVFGYYLLNPINVYDENDDSNVIGDLGFTKFGPIATYHAGAYNSYKTYKAGDRWINNAYDEQMDSPGRICVTPGTYWPAITANATTTAANPVVNVSDATDFLVGTYIDIAGVTGPLRITAKNCLNDTITVSPAPDASVGPLVPTYHAPTFIEETPGLLAGGKTWNAPNIANGASAQTTQAVTGVKVGDIVLVSCGIDTQGMICYGYVSAADTVTFGLANLTGGAIDLDSTYYRIRVLRVTAG